MSAVEEKNGKNDEDNPVLNPDAGNLDSGAVNEGNELQSDSNKNVKIDTTIADMPQLTPYIPLSGSGEPNASIKDILAENLLKLKQTETQILEMTKKILSTDVGKGSGDYTATAKVSDDGNIDLSEATTSKANIFEKNKSSDGTVEKEDEINAKKSENSDDLEDDDMELRWDDDDGSDQAADDHGKLDATNDDILSEEQLLEDPPDDPIGCAKTKVQGDENTGDNDVSKDKESKINPTASTLSTQLNTSTVESDKIMEDELLNEDDMSRDENETKKSVDTDNVDSILEQELLEETEIDTGSAEKAPANTDVIPETDNFIEKNVNKENDNLVEETERTLETILAIDNTDKTTDKNDDTLPLGIDNTNMKPRQSGIRPDTAASIEKKADESIDIFEEAQLLAKADESTAKDIDEIEKDKTLATDNTLEDRLLEETDAETVVKKVVPKTFVSMEIDDDEKEDELLNDDDSRYYTCVSMDVDITDQSIDDLSRVGEKTIDPAIGTVDLDPSDSEADIDKATDNNTMKDKDLDKALDDIDEKGCDDIEMAETSINEPSDNQNAIEKKDSNKDIDKDKHVHETIDNQTIDVESKTTKDTENQADIEDEIENIDNQEKILEQSIDASEKMDEVIDQSIKLLPEPSVSVSSPNETEKMNKGEMIEKDFNQAIDIQKPTEKENDEAQLIDTAKAEQTSTVSVEIVPAIEDIDPQNDNSNVQKASQEKTLQHVDNNDTKITPNTKIDLEDSPGIKTDHGLHKPDVMLEIPTQELIDMDDTDFSMNLDQSEVMDCENNGVRDKVADIKVIAAPATDQNAMVAESAIDQNTTVAKPVDVQNAIVTKPAIDQNAMATEPAIDQNTTVTGPVVDLNAIVIKPSVSQDAVVSKSTAGLDENDTVTKPALDQHASASEPQVVQDTTESEPTLVQDATETEIPVVQQATETEIPVVQDATVSEPVVQAQKAIENVVVSQVQETIEESLEKMFAEDEPAVQEIENIASTSQNLQSMQALSETSQNSDTLQALKETTSQNLPLQALAEKTNQKIEALQALSEKASKILDTIQTLPEISQNLDTSQAIPEKTSQNIETLQSLPETSQNVDTQQSLAEKSSQNVATLEAKPSTSTAVIQMTPDTSDEVPEISDSLGLLAESAGRMMEDDEEPDDDDDGDDDDDFDQDESSNQISAEQSEDSNPAASETEPVRNQDKELDTPDPKEGEFQFTISSVDGASNETGDKMDVEEDSNVQLEAESIKDDQLEAAVDSVLKDAESPSKEQNEEPQEAVDQMDIETVKLSDVSDNDLEDEPIQFGPEVSEQSNVQTNDQRETPTKSPKQSPTKSPLSPSKKSPSKQSPNKIKKLEITTLVASQVVNIVDLEESSSSEDDIQEVDKPTEPETPVETSTVPDESVTNVNIPNSIEIMCTSGGNTSEIVTKEGEVVISGVPKPPPHKPARLNTSEVSIKTVSNTEPLVIPETKINEQGQQTPQSKPKLSLEIFSLDSDDEDSAVKEKPSTSPPHKMTAVELEKARETSKCINYCCTSGFKVPYKVADAAVVAYYDAGRKRRSMVCLPCAEVVANRTENLIKGIKDMKPLLDLDMDKLSQDLVEISDSESEDEDLTPEEPKESIGEKGADFLDENLAKFINETWIKYDMDTRLRETQIMLDDEIERLEQDSKEIDAMLNECQVATDKLRNELYATFECRREELAPLVVYDTPDFKLSGLESRDIGPKPPAEKTVNALPGHVKRRLSSSSEVPAKRPAIPLGYTPLTDSFVKGKPTSTSPISDVKIDDDKDISVVKLSAESAPAELPPPGEISRPPLRVSMPVYAMKNAFGPWLKGKIIEIQPKNASAGNAFSLCRVKFDHKAKTNGKILPARCIAYAEPADVRMTIGTRLIALFKDSNKRESYYSGVVAEIPNPVNNYRYLVFFDDGYAQYVQHQYTRLVCESSPLVWEEVHPFSREFVREYLMAYPERPMVRLHEGQHLKTEWNGKWWSSRVTRVDASLAQVMFVGDGRREWIYRGSTRLAPLYLELRAAERHRPRPMPRSKAQPRMNMPYVEYTRSDEQESNKQQETATQQQQQNEEIRRQRAVAKKSTSVPQVAPPPPQQAAGNLDTVTSRVVYYTPKNAVKPYKMTAHRCGPKCKRSDVLSLKELRTYNPLAKPLLSGWERQIVRFKGHKEVMYRAPCGRRVRSVRELHAYLRATDSDLPVDLFDFHPATHCLAEFVLNKCLVGKKDLSHGKENVPVPCVNYYDDSLPEFCSYNTERTPTAGVPLNLDPEFLCGCDCTDDCQDKSKCACWKMTLEGARTIGLEGPNVGYVYKRLPEPLPSGIYECNSRCKCKHTCLNRVAQHPLQLKLQVFKTLNRGWGIRALNDVPKGSFLCVYAGNLLTDATANLDGLNEGDEYLAELDYIEVVEQMKEGYEEDIPETDKKLDKKESREDDGEEDEDRSSSDEEEAASKTDKEDDDFRPGSIGLGVMEFNKRLRKRERSKKDKDKPSADDKEKEREKDKEKDKDTKESNGDEECITISDDEEVREPSRFTVQAGMGANEFVSKYKSVRTLFGKDEACYIMDAKVQGNIGRYLNHSCCPNVFVQNVFVDTHDPRFPWVAFFALSHIKAGTELTWNYNYDVGSVPGKILYCHCGAPNCRGRLL